MALRTLGTLATTSLSAVAYAPANVLAPADLAAVSQGIVPDTYARSGGGGVVTTGTTATSTALTAIASMTRVQAGMLVLGAGIVPGTYVVSVNVGASSAVLSKATTASAAGVNLLFVPADYGIAGAFSFSGPLVVPGRGVLQVLPGDMVAVDNSGWPILVSAASIALTGSRWVT